MALNLLDVATASLHWHGNLPLPRFLLGLVLGVASRSGDSFAAEPIAGASFSGGFAGLGECSVTCSGIPRLKIEM